MWSNVPTDDKDGDGDDRSGYDNGPAINDRRSSKTDLVRFYLFFVHCHAIYLYDCVCCCRPKQVQQLRTNNFYDYYYFLLRIHPQQQ